jgi:hypothetical protein
MPPSRKARRMTNSRPECMDALGRAWDIRGSWLLSTPQEGWRRLYARWLRRALGDLAGPGDEPPVDLLEGCR